MNYPDLKSYTVGEPPQQNLIKIVGWLTKDQLFAKGKVDTQVLDRLWEFCKQPLGQGIRKNACQLCPPGTPILVEYNGEQQDLSRWRLLLLCNDQAAYLAPHVIFHYITAHQYLPPQEFLDVIMSMPLPTPNPQAYFDAIEPYYANLADIEKIYADIAEQSE